MILDESLIQEVQMKATGANIHISDIQIVTKLIETNRG